MRGNQRVIPKSIQPAQLAASSNACMHAAYICLHEQDISYVAQALLDILSHCSSPCSSPPQHCREFVCGALAHSFTACIYLLPPHATPLEDMLIMAALSRHVTLIPVIAKGDAMTEQEADEYKQELQHLLRQPLCGAPQGVTVDPFW